MADTNLHSHLRTKNIIQFPLPQHKQVHSSLRMDYTTQSDWMRGVKSNYIAVRIYLYTILTG